MQRSYFKFSAPDKKRYRGVVENGDLTLQNADIQ